MGSLGYVIVGCFLLGTLVGGVVMQLIMWFITEEES